MSNGLLVPTHIKKEQEMAKQNVLKQKELKDEPKEEPKKTVEEAYVEPEEKVLDPTLLSRSLLERMPSPTGWRLLVLPYKGKAVTDGGIMLTEATLEKRALTTVVAYVLKMGPLCYKDTNKFGADVKWCQERDWVLIGRYSGARFRLEDDAEVRIINDDEVLATILNPDDITHVA